MLLCRVEIYSMLLKTVKVMILVIVIYVKKLKYFVMFYA